MGNVTRMLITGERPLKHGTSNTELPGCRQCCGHRDAGSSVQGTGAAHIHSLTNPQGIPWQENSPKSLPNGVGNVICWFCSLLKIEIRDEKPTSHNPDSLRGSVKRCDGAVGLCPCLARAKQAPSASALGTRAPCQLGVLLREFFPLKKTTLCFAG